MGGSLFHGVNDEGEIVGLENVPADADFISEMIKARLDPVPKVQLIPIEHEGRALLEVKVKAGVLTPFIITKTECARLLSGSAMKVWNYSSSGLSSTSNSKSFRVHRKMQYAS